MKIVMVFDQIQAGAGIKDDHMVPLGLMKGAVGPAIMMEPYLKTYNGQVLACLYCGDGYYAENKQECLRKYCAMVEKIKPDVVRWPKQYKKPVWLKRLRLSPRKMKRRLRHSKTVSRW